VVRLTEAAATGGKALLMPDVKGANSLPWRREKGRRRPTPRVAVNSRVRWPGKATTSDCWTPELRTEPARMIGFCEPQPEVRGEKMYPAQALGDVVMHVDGFMVDGKPL